MLVSLHSLQYTIFYMSFRIAELKDPRDRMLQVLKWYLSSYHAGRKSSVAKKPYNPILGEVFRCHWDLDEQPSDEPVSNGPVPWCNRNQLVFVAEQVSHHPPSMLKANPLFSSQINVLVFSFCLLCRTLQQANKFQRTCLHKI